MTMKKRSWLHDALLIFFGTLITALALNMFLIPNKIAAGGVSGIATVIYYLFKFPVGVVMLVLNLPIFLLGIKEIGTVFGIKTLISTILLSLMIDFIKVPCITREVILASVYGGILMGIGLGLVFKANATTGGTDMAARIIHKYVPFIGIGWVMFVIDFVVVAAAGIVFGSEQALYALVSLFLGAKMIDLIQEGFNSAKAFIIISNKADMISNRILNEMNRGVTGLHGKGMFSGYEKEILLCIISRTEITRLKEIVVDEDPYAFVIVTNVREVLGEGFTASASFQIKGS